MKNMRYILFNRPSINGFRVYVFHEHYKLYQVMPKKLASGEIEYTEDITRGLEKDGKAILEKGMNVAKIIVVADDWTIEAISNSQVT
ncbi:MAG: hypothetical protein NXY57DRAFT_627607 [Lentinula lateritia]|nr:MAG: hypothetical protein NXY57DRAFT_627607 [Lentinula lateritia]